MKVLYYNRNEIPKEKLDFDCEYCGNLDELLERSDVVSLHMPVSKQISGLFLLLLSSFRRGFIWC